MIRPENAHPTVHEKEGFNRLVEFLPPITCISLILVFAIFFSILSVQQHRAFLTNGLDVGNVDQALWNTAQGRFLQFTLMTPVQSRLALHVEPILLLFVPLYWLNLGSPELLLVTQATVAAIGAWPLYLLSRGTLLGLWKQGNGGAKVKSPPHPWAFASILLFPLTYLLLPTLESAVLFDFHAVTLASTFFLFAFLALAQKNNRSFIFWAGLAMACKEDMPLVVAMMGLYVGLTQRRWRLAGLTIGLSFIWFATAVFVIQPTFATGGNIQLDRYAWLGNSPLTMLQTVITQPHLILEHLWYQANLPDYLITLLFPTAFLALFSPLTLLPILPSLAINLLSNNPFTWRLEDFHYGAPIAPFLFISTIYGIRRISQWATRQNTNKSPHLLISLSPHLQISPVYLLITLLTFLLFIFSTIYHYHRGFTPLARPFLWPQVTPHHQHLETLLTTIPADTPLFTQSNLAPHLTHRPTLYTDFGYFTDPDFPATEQVNDILLDITAFENIGGLHQFLRSILLESGNYQLIAAQDGIFHFKPITPNSPTLNLQPPIQNPKPVLSKAEVSKIQNLNHSLQVDFGSAMRLHGYSLHFNRQEEIEVTVDLEPLQPLTDIRPVLYLLDAQGQPAGATTDLPPALVWYPIEQWPVGNTIRVRFNTLPWHTRQTSVYRLALGVMSDSDVWDVERRYKPVISQPTKLAVRFPANGSLIELATIKQSWRIPYGGPQQRQFTQPFIPNRFSANFDNQIKLLGYTSPYISNQSNGSTHAPNFQISLYWQAIATPESLTRFVQLIGPDGQVYGQQDSAPDYNTYPTSLWQPGEIVAETVTFPIQSEQPDGTYTLHIGLYRPATGERLQLHSGADHIEISTYALKK